MTGHVLLRGREQLSYFWVGLKMRFHCVNGSSQNYPVYLLSSIGCFMQLNSQWYIFLAPSSISQSISRSYDNITKHFPITGRYFCYYPVTHTLFWNISLVSV